MGFENDFSSRYFFHQLVDHDRLCLEFVATVDQMHFAGDIGQIQGFFDRGIAATDHANHLLAVEKSVAGGAARDSAAHKGLFRGEP